MGVNGCACVRAWGGGYSERAQQAGVPASNSGGADPPLTLLLLGACADGSELSPTFSTADCCVSLLFSFHPPPFFFLLPFSRLYRSFILCIIYLLLFSFR